MQANDAVATSETRGTPAQIASLRHLAGFLLIALAVVVLGIKAQHGQPDSSSSGQLASHNIAVQVYLVAIVLDWALFYYCWVGVHRRGSSLWSLAGARWTSWKSVARDVAVVLPFWAIWEGAAWATHWLLGPNTAKTVDSLLPKRLLEIAVWIATCITAGICEEMVFRGYLQRQFHALIGSNAAAIALQGVVFGIFHGYQGWKNVIVISVLGILYGLLAAWRKNLHANIVSHAWSDIWEGWLKFLIWR